MLRIDLRLSINGRSSLWVNIGCPYSSNSPLFKDFELIVYYALNGTILPSLKLILDQRLLVYGIKPSMYKIEQFLQSQICQCKIALIRKF